MAFKKKNIYEIIGAALVLSALLSTASAVDCLGKSFHCVNSTHFMICVDVGGGVSQSIADFTIPCPPPTVCQGNNHFECEFPITTTPSTTLSNVISESTMPWEEVDVTTVSPLQNTTKEYSEKYMNTESLTSLSANSYTTDATVEYTTEATSLIDSVNITETRTVVTEILPYDTTISNDDIAQTRTVPNVASTGQLLSETANNYSSVQVVTDDAGLVSTSTEKAVPSKLNTTEALSLIDGISATETGPAVTEALPYYSTTNQDVITQMITEHNTGKLLTETTNNYTLEKYLTTNEGLVSTSTEKPVPSKLNNTVAASLVDDISITKTGPTVTEALTYDTTTNLDVITQPITEHNEESAGELLSETANNYTQGQEVTNNAGLVSNSTEKAVPLQLNTTEAALLIDDITIPAITEALPYDTTISKDAIRETKTEHNVSSAGASLTETANNYPLKLEVTNNAGSVSTSTEKSVPSKLNTVEAASLIDDISITDTNLAVTEALPYDTTTSQDIVTQTITEHNVSSAGASLTETANNYPLKLEVTNNAGSVSTSTEKAVPSKLNTTEAISLIDGISATETGPAVTEALPYYSTTNQDVITDTNLAVTEALPYDTTASQDIVTQTITEHNVASAGEPLTETANNYTLVQEVKNNASLVSTNTEKAVLLQLNSTETALLIDDISITETSPAITEALPYDTTTSKDVIRETITEHNVASAGESLTETANNYTLQLEITNNAGLVSNSTEKAVPSKLNTTEATPLIYNISITETGPTVTEALPYDSTTSNDAITQTITDHIVAAAGGLLTESANTLVQQITTDEGLVSLNTETTKVDIRKINNVTEKSAFKQVKTTTESIPTEIIVVNGLPTTTDNVFATDANLINTDLRASNSNMSDDRLTTESAAATAVDGIIAGVNIFTTEHPTVQNLLQTTPITNSLNYATITTESTTVENVGFNERNLTLFGKDAVTDTNVNSGIEISLSQDQNITNNQTLSTKNISSESSPTEQKLVNILNNSISSDVSSILTTETVYLITNGTWSRNEDVLDQTNQTSDSMVTVASVDTELPTKGYVTTVPSVDLVQNAENQSMFNYVTPIATTMVEEKIRTERPNITLFEENTVKDATTNLITESPLILKLNLTDNAPDNQIPIDNTGLGSSSTEPEVIPTLDIGHSINPDHFARGTEIVTTEETKYNVLDQATLELDTIVAVIALPTSIDDNFTTETNVIKNNEVPSAENKLLNTNMSNQTITTKTVILENHFVAKQQNFTTDNGRITEAPPHIFGTNTNDNILNPNLVKQAAFTSNIDFDENLASAVNDNLIAKKNPIVSVNNLENSPKHLEFVEYNVTEHPKPIIIDENLLSDNNYIMTSSSDTENKINSSLSDSIGKSTEKSAVQYNVSTEQLIIQEIQGKVEVADNYHLDLAVDGITKEPNYFIHGDTTSATKSLAAGVESYNKIEDQVSTTEVILDVHKNMAHANNSNRIVNQAKEYVQKVVDSLGIEDITTESNLKESETSLHATVATDKPNFGALPTNTKSDDSGKTTTLYSHEINPELINHKDLLIAEETKQLNTNLAPITSINDYLTDSSLNNNTKNKTDLDSHIAVKAEDHTSTMNGTNANENKKYLQGIIINTTDNTILKAQEGSTNYMTTTFKTYVLEPEKNNIDNTLQSGPNVQDLQYHNPPTETYVGLHVDNYSKLTIEESFSHVYKSSQIPSQNNYFTTTGSIVINDANIITEKSTSINGVDLKEVSGVNNNIYLPQLDTILQRPAISSVITDKQKIHSNTVNQDDESLTTKFTTADVNVASNQIGNQAIDLPEKTIGHTGTTTVYIRDANQNKIDDPPSVLQTRNSTPTFPQLNDVKNVHQPIGAFTDVNYNVAESKSSVQEPAQTTQENTNTKAKASNARDDISNNITGKTLESFLTRQNTTINLPTEITTDSFLEPYPATSTSRTINASKPANEAQVINNVFVTGKPMILVVRNKSTDYPLTQPQVVKEIRSDVNTSSSVIANAEQSHVNVSRKIGTITKTLFPQNHTNATKEVAKTQRNATSSHKVVNTINSTTQASVKRVPLRPVSSVTENPTKKVLSSPQFKYNCINGTRGRYSDKNDCRKFYICVGNNRPIVGTCPGNTVFSDIKKLCTRNMSHCIRENQFKCPSAGRFSDLINDVYYICVNHKNSLYRFKFQCQKGFSLNKTITRCMENKVIVPNDSVSIPLSDGSESSTASSPSKSSSNSSIRSGSRGDSDSSNSSQSKKSVEKKDEELEKPDNKEEDDESEEIFVCRKEGKFPIRNECRRYYLCKKNGKSEYRRKMKKCRSGDVFHKSKKRCVDAESYEC